MVVLEGVEVGLGDSERLEAVYDDVEQDVVHALAVLNARVRRGEQHLTQQRRQVPVHRLLR